QIPRRVVARQLAVYERPDRQTLVEPGDDTAPIARFSAVGTHAHSLSLQKGHAPARRVVVLLIGLRGGLRVDVSGSAHERVESALLITAASTVCHPSSSFATSREQAHYSAG